VGLAPVWERVDRQSFAAIANLALHRIPDNETAVYDDWKLKPLISIHRLHVNEALLPGQVLCPTVEPNREHRQKDHRAGQSQEKHWV